MYSTSWYKRLFRTFGVEIKRFEFGLDPWADIKSIFHARPPELLFDVGANRGQTSVQLATILPDPKIMAFEPNPNVFSELQRSVARFPQVSPVQMALGEQKRRITLNLCASSVNSSVLRYSREDGADRIVDTVEVEMNTLDHFCAERGIESIDLLKTDVQGYELEVFKGAKSMLESNGIQAVFCEVNIHKLYDGQCSFEEIYTYLKGYGFNLCGFYSIVREDGWHIHWADALFIRPEHFGKRLTQS
jgi:FkbM family methyltransferase